uniref:hypothetical protein n=1 Tax=Bifidobacterium adolescentis TaxID=1680 RepID=UPI00359C6484
MTKITPEFKRAFRHYVDGAGRMGLLTEADVIELQQVLRPRSEDSGIAELYGYWDDQYTQFDVVCAFRKAFDYVYVRDIELLRAHGQAITVDAVRGLLDRYAAIMGREQGTADACGLLMVPPALHEELVRSDAERQVIREKMADYWRHVSTELLGLLRNVGECDLGLYATFSEWVENACAYWATQQELHGRQSAEGEANYATHMPMYWRKITGNGRRTGNPKTVRNLRDWYMPYESLQDIMAAFCAAYSHGIDPYTGKRPYLPKD